MVKLCCLTVSVSLMLWQQESSLGTAGPARGQESTLAQSRAGKHQTTSALAAHRPLPHLCVEASQCSGHLLTVWKSGCEVGKAREAFSGLHAGCRDALQVKHRCRADTSKVSSAGRTNTTDSVPGFSPCLQAEAGDTLRNNC